MYLFIPSRSHCEICKIHLYISGILIQGEKTKFYRFLLRRHSCQLLSTLRRGGKETIPHMMFGYTAVTHYFGKVPLAEYHQNLGVHHSGGLEPERPTKIVIVPIKIKIKLSKIYFWGTFCQVRGNSWEVKGGKGCRWGALCLGEQKGLTLCLKVNRGYRRPSIQVVRSCDTSHPPGAAQPTPILFFRKPPTYPFNFPFSPS